MKLRISYHLPLAILILGCSFHYIYGKGGRGGGGGRSSSSGRGYSSSSSRSSSSSSRYSPSSSGGYPSASSSRYSPSSSSRYSPSSSSRYSPSSSSGHSSASSSRYSPSSSSRYSPSSSSRYAPSSGSRYSPLSSPRYWPSSNNGYSSPSMRQSPSSSSINFPSSNTKYSFSDVNGPKWDSMLANIREQARKDAERTYSRRTSYPRMSSGSKLTPPPYNSLSRQPAYNPNFKELNVGSAPSHSGIQHSPQPAYNPNFKELNIGPQPPSYSSFGRPSFYSPESHRTGQHIFPSGASSIPNFGSHPQQSSLPKPYPVQPVPMNAHSSQAKPYPVQPSVVNTHSNQPPASRPYPVQRGVMNSQPPYSSVPSPYPVQPGAVKPYPVQPGAVKPYPVQPGMLYPQPAHLAGQRPYHVQPGAAKPYPVQPGMPLGANVWHAHSGIPPPAYMNYGGLPTGTNMHNKPHKKKGFLGSLISAGKPSYSKPKHYSSFPNPYGTTGFGSTGYSNGLGSFLGKHGNTGTMYTILPYMNNKKARKLFKPKIGYHPVFFHRHHHHHHHSGFHNNYEHEVKSETYQDVQSSNYAGQCKRPLRPNNSVLACNSTINEINCQINCSKGYTFPDKSTNKTNKCWHMTGVWRPTKNFPSCEPVCNMSCLNGGKCIGPDVCGCKSEYRGPRCEFHYLKCDIQQLIREQKISWVCTHKKNETSCQLKCKPPAEFANAVAAREYRCSVNGTWTPSTEPDCVVKGTTTDAANASEVAVTETTKLQMEEINILKDIL